MIVPGQRIRRQLLTKKEVTSIFLLTKNLKDQKKDYRHKKIYL